MNLVKVQRDDFLDRENVSRETMDRLDYLAEKTRKWSAMINLISDGSLETIWSRHISDSAQLFTATGPRRGRWLDLGSGAGFPGLVIAILASENSPSFQVTLVESDKRKCVFLSTTIQELGIDAKVENSRIENLVPQFADVISARALAPLPKLLDLAIPHLAPGGLCLFPKGRNYHSELKDAVQSWKLSYKLLKSRTDPNARILRIHEAIRV